jgi:hypothetical protein
MRFGMSGAPLNTAKRLDTQAKTIHLNYRLMLEAWVKVFPAAQIILRNYADVLKGGGSVADFSACCGVSLPAGLTHVPRSNISRPFALSEILRQANAALPAPQAALLRDEVARHTPALVLPPNRDIECFGAEGRARLHRLFAPSADYLQGLTGAPFFPDLEEILNTRPVPAADAGRDALRQLQPLIVESALPEEVKHFLAGVRIE